MLRASDGALTCFTCAHVCLHLVLTIVVAVDTVRTTVCNQFISEKSLNLIELKIDPASDSNRFQRNVKQESRAAARKPRVAASVLFR